MTAMDPRAELDSRIDAIESGYEYFLAYAAQGRTSDRDKGAQTSSLREHLEKMYAALDGLGDVIRACASSRDAKLVGVCAAFFAAIDDDARTTRGVLRLAMAKENISSQLIDNLNASIHLRALLTDLFIVDEGLKN
jgi:hypothetical protein